MVSSTLSIVIDCYVMDTGMV